MLCSSSKTSPRAPILSGRLGHNDDYLVILHQHLLGLSPLQACHHINSDLRLKGRNTGDGPLLRMSMLQVIFVLVVACLSDWVRHIDWWIPFYFVGCAALAPQCWVWCTGCLDLMGIMPIIVLSFIFSGAINTRIQVDTRIRHSVRTARIIYLNFNLKQCPWVRLLVFIFISVSKWFHPAPNFIYVYLQYSH